jgi:hypothetical protein
MNLFGNVSDLNHLRHALSIQTCAAHVYDRQISLRQIVKIELFPISYVLFCTKGFCLLNALKQYSQATGPIENNLIALDELYGNLAEAVLEGLQSGLEWRHIEIAMKQLKSEIQTRPVSVTSVEATPMAARSMAAASR